MDFRCPNCHFDLEQENPSKKYFDVKNGVTSAGYYYQCSSCNSLLVKHEHDIEKKLRFTPLWIITLLNLNFMMAGIFWYSIRHLNLLFVVILLIGLSFYLPIVKKHFIKKIPSNWLNWQLYARAKDNNAVL
jgi:hypothetical protein